MYTCQTYVLKTTLQISEIQTKWGRTCRTRYLHKLGEVHTLKFVKTQNGDYTLTLRMVLCPSQGILHDKWHVAYLCRLWFLWWCAYAFFHRANTCHTFTNVQCASDLVWMCGGNWKLYCMSTNLCRPVSTNHAF